MCGKYSSALDGVSIYYFPQVEGIMGRYLIAREQSSICETYYFNGSSDFEYYRLDEIPDDGRPSMEDYLKIGSSKAGIYPDLSFAGASGSLTMDDDLLVKVMLPAPLLLP